MTFWKSANFKELTKDWYKRLKEDGFRDIEQDEEHLKDTSYKAYQGADEIVRETKLLYYTLISQNVGRTSFPNEVDGIILMLHAEGNNIKRICDKLCEYGLSRNRHTVRVTIRRYEMLWGIRQYTPNQLNKYPRKK